MMLELGYSSDGTWMEISVEKKGPVAILSMDGSLTFEGDELLRQKVLGLLEDGVKLFILNMTRVPFIDSVGLGETVACTKRVCDRGGTVKLVLRPGQKVLDVFRVTQLDKAYQIFADEEEALASWIP